MKHLIFFLAAFLPALLPAQVETTEWKGETWYVYPHQSELLTSSALSFRLFAKKEEVLLRDDKNRKVISTTIRPVDERYASYIRNDKELKSVVKLLKRLVAEHPEELFSYGNITETGFTPALEELPDGRYVQFYKDVAYLDKETLRYRNDIVAASFTVKNGEPDGLATFYDVQGREMLRGNYVGGARNGEWKSFILRTDYGKGSKPSSYEQLLALKNVDTVRETLNYSAGLMNGPYSLLTNLDTLASGSYKNDKQTGTWKYWQYEILKNAAGEPEVTGKVILKSRFTIAENPVPAKSVIVRDYFVYFEEMGEMYDSEGADAFNFPSGISSPNTESFSEFYKINYDEGEEIELPEEDLNSFEGEEGDYADYYEFDEEPEHESDFRNRMIDSLGYIFEYTGVYETYYPNGQLEFRFEVVDGKLRSEEPLYWDNGKIASSVTFKADSNIYVAEYFDYDGKLYITERFDANGKSLDTISEDYSGYYEDPPGYSYLNELDVYVNKNAFKESPAEKLVLEQRTWMRLGTPAYLETYDPATKTLETTVTAVNGKEVRKRVMSFSGDFSSVNGYEDITVGDLRLHRQFNGFKNEFSMPFLLDGIADSTLTDEQKYVQQWYYSYSVSYDNVLYYRDKPFSGRYDINLHKKGYSLKAGPSSVSISIPESEEELLRKASEKYAGKGKDSPLLGFVNTEETLDPIYKQLMSLTPFADYDFVSAIEPSYLYEERMYGPKLNKSVPYIAGISGMMVDGRPQGLWTAKDQKGKVVVELPFENGEENGTYKITQTALPLSRSEMERIRLYNSDEFYQRVLAESHPSKITRYTATVASFRNGLLSGPNITYGWRGDTLGYTFYRDGSKQGYSFERNRYIFSETTYENDENDGISRTWLTLPGKDSVLLYDLNFQNGMLQGESKAYHANGKLAKRGFFLTGQPIDDYEAFDTLGFRYQYVKFKYNQPVEEKIWEENQLSLRYLFDWRDSIAFDISDIAESPSVQQVMSELGIENDEYYEPYMGRPSLVDKSGIDYYMIKYYPNDTMAREGFISKGKKSACWKYYSYEGKLLYEVDYADTVITLNDSIRFRSKGILSFLDENGLATSHSYIIEKFEKYDCSHTDHYEQRMLYCFWEKDASSQRRNGYVVNYYDNGAKMSEGNVKDGLPDGVWKMYDNSGHLNKVGEYKLGKRQGRWLTGDLTNVKFLGDICLNPNLPNLEEIMKYQEKLIDITVIYYKNGKSLRTENYGINMNSGEAPEGIYEDYYGE